MTEDLTDRLLDESGWYWIEHKGEEKPAWWNVDEGRWQLGRSGASPWISPEYATVLSELPGPEAADRLDAAMLHIAHLEALAAQIRALPADTDEIPGLRRELKSLKRQAGEYLGEARPDALREQGGGD